MKPPFENLKGRRVYQFVLDEKTGKIEDISDSFDYVKVRHGKWIDETFESWGLVHHPFKCNLCGEHAEFASPYCPNCGAKMDAEQKKPYFPKGFFSKERPLAKGEEDETD